MSLQLIEGYCSEGVEAVLEKGYQWFHNTLTPALQKVSEENPTETILLGEAWLIAGEVHELLYAPNQAITCYQISLHFNPFSSDTYRWLAIVQEQLGNYLKAMKNIEFALKYTTDGVTLMEDRQRIQDCIVYDKDADFHPDNSFWKYSELLAAGNFDVIIQEIGGIKTKKVDLLRCLYRAFGGKQAKTEGIAIWQQILRLETDVVLEEVDLFYWK